MKNKTFFIVLVVALFVFVISTFSYFAVTGNALRYASEPGDGKKMSFLCKFSVDFCDCTPSRWCINSNSYAWKGQNCVVKTAFCASGQICSNGYCETPAPANSCTDSDRGINYTVRGTVNTTFTSVNGTAYNSYTDYCQSTSMLREYYCNGVYVADQQNVNCQYGCSNGACSITQPKPDLIVQSASAYNFLNNTMILANIKNIGGSTAGQSTTRIHISSIGVSRYLLTPQIVSGGVVQVSANFSLLTSGGVNITADFFNNVTESNEANNFYINYTLLRP